jgi:hypothetical protein
MATLKRAKWIEGITQSKRILHDLAEIVTSAIKDENGIIAAENWSLIYPRPFLEESIFRGRLIQDKVNTRQYTPVADRSELVVMSTAGTPLKEPTAMPSTIVVKSEDLSITYALGADYTYDATAKKLMLVAGGKLKDGDKVQVDYGITFSQILKSVPTLIEKQLTAADPDRVIATADYTVDRVNKRVTFLADPPADADYFELDFTEISGPFKRTTYKMVKLQPDTLDPTGRSFILPYGYGEIAAVNDVRILAESPAGATGSNPSGSVQYTLDGTNHKITFTAGAEKLAENQSLTIDCQVYRDATITGTQSLTDIPLIPDTSDATGNTYIMSGVFPYPVITTLAHDVKIHTTTEPVVVYDHLLDINTSIANVDPDDLKISYNPPLVMAMTDIKEELYITCTARGEDDLQVGLSKITDRVVLKTVTEPEQKFDVLPDDQYGAKDTTTNLTMYVELQKPVRLVNPETGLERYADYKGIQQQTQLNNHYILTRMFDKWDDSIQKPQDATYDVDGSLISKGAYVSDWVKYSWFKDWKEFMVDEVDSDPGISDASDGIIFQEVEVQGMTEEFPVQFWVSTNNNRFALVLMGDPTLDQDNFLTSFGYFGRVHPFYDSQYIVKKDDKGAIVLDTNGDPVLEEKRTYFENDVQGNFAITVGSSTIPAAIGTPPKGTAVLESVSLNTQLVDKLGTDGKTTKVAVPIVGELYDFSAYSYLVTYLTEIGESKPTPLDKGRIVIPRGTVVGVAGTSAAATTPIAQGVSTKIRFTLPDEATGYRIYRYDLANAVACDAVKSADYANYKLVTSVDKIDRERTIEYIDEGNILPMYKSVFDATTNAVALVLMPSTAPVPYSGSGMSGSTGDFYKNFVAAVGTARSFESVIRDKFTHEIIDVKFSNKYGKDTATGVSDIMMFQTRSGLKYQRHQAAFITTEEFMRKEKSGQSRWTGKFHLSPIYIEHSYDKQRGWLDGVMAVDDSGIEHLDELIVDKDTPNEEVYKFFRVNAPYSMFNNSPNYSYGIAIIKTSMKWS